MQIENHLPFAVVVCTYDIGDFLCWIPWQVHNLEPRTIRTIAAHDRGQCKLKIEILDGPRIWVLDSPQDVTYSDHDVVRIGPCIDHGPATPPHHDPDRARAEFLSRNRDQVVPADDWIPGARPRTSAPMVRAVMGEQL